MRTQIQAREPPRRQAQITLGASRARLSKSGVASVLREVRGGLFGLGAARCGESAWLAAT
jgi:hypothetical protein